jgi:hypothetical protein
MGKLIHFPVARLRSHRAAAVSVFHAFGELESLERQQLKLIAGSALIATLALVVAQLVIG